MAPLHASAVDYHEKGLLFCGLDGSGKTCCALSLMDDENTHLISDNLVLVGAGKVYSCYEQVRLHQEYFGSFQQYFHYANKPRIRHKGFYRLPDSKMINGQEINAVFFVESASENRIEKITLNEAAHRAVHLSRLSGELQRYSFFYSFYDLLADGSAVSENQIVRSSFEKADSFRLRLNFSDGVKHCASFLKEHADMICR